MAQCSRDAVRAIFAGGSLGRGEVWAAQIGERVEIYSDVDLYVVLASPGRRDDVIRAARDAATSMADEEDNVRFLRPVDVGVYSEHDLLSQPVRPGTVDLALHSVFLHGDRTILTPLAAAMSRPMDAGEALYLLENRALELTALDGSPGDARARSMLVMALKARLDVDAAYAIASGTFAPTLSARETEFTRGARVGLPAAAERALADAYASTHDLGAWLATADAGAEMIASLQFLAAAWRALGAALMGGREDHPGELASRRCREGQWLSNGREMIRLRRAVAAGRWTSVRAAARFAHFSPRAALRLHALVCEWSREQPAWDASLRAQRDYVDALTRALGFERGLLEVRAITAHRAIS